MVEKLQSRWENRDFPVLVAAARLIEESDVGIAEGSAIAEATGLPEEEVIRALTALESVYILGKPLSGWGGTIAYDAHGLTERGRRVAGLWPSGEAADALVEALRQAEDAVSDPEEKTLIRRATGALGTVSREVMTDVMAAVIKSQTGL